MKMSMGFIFWLLMVLWVFFLGGLGWRNKPEDRMFLPAGAIVFVLLFLLGWKVFGFIVQS